MDMRIYSYLVSIIPKKFYYYVNAYVIGLSYGDNTIPLNIGSTIVRSRCAHIPRVFNEISPKYQYDVVGILLLQVVIYHNASMCNVFAALNWDISVVNKENGVRNIEYFPYSLCQSSQLICKLVFP